MKIRILEKNQKQICLICAIELSNVNKLGYHLKKCHNKTSTDYSIEDIYKFDLPKCKCGCGKPVVIRKFVYDEYTVGHNPKCAFWQIKYDKDSEEFKIRAQKLGDKLKKYYEENPKIVSEDTRKLLSDNRKQFISDNPEIFQGWIDKMKITKQQQSELGLLSGENHYYNKLNLEEQLEVINKRYQTINNKTIEEKQEMTRQNSERQKKYWNNLTTEEQQILLAKRLEALNDIPIEKRLEKNKKHSEWIKHNFTHETGLFLRPLYNKLTIPYINEILSVKFNTIFRHAESENGEFRIYDAELNRFYFADAYSEELNIWVEFDEPNKFKNGILKEEHLTREERIKKIRPDIEIIRIYFDKNNFNPNTLVANDSPLGGRLIVE